MRQELKDIDLSPPKIIMDATTAQSGPTERVLGSPDPSGARSASPNLSGAGPASSDPWVRTPPLPTPGDRIHS
jgi:hypothetical protein